ncbi:MAG: cytochrome P460 family protein [Trueperaceae bacterium]
MKRATKTLVAVFAVVLLGVAVWAQQSSAGIAEDLTGYWTWERANAQKSFIESMHPVAKDVYFNETAASTAHDQSFPYAEGSAVVKETLDASTMQVVVLTAMRKVTGFDPDNGDWQYGMFERQADGSFMGGWMDPESSAMCVSCHVGAADRDYTFLSYLH